MMRRVALVAAALLLGFRGAVAQYDEPMDDAGPADRFLRLGVEFRRFEPQEPTADSSRVDYSAVMPLVGFRQGPVDILVGYTTFSQDGVSRSAAFIATTIAVEIPLSRGRTGGLALPLMIAADFTKAEAAGPSRNTFNVATVGIGAGLQYRYLGRSMRLTLQAAQAAAYATEAYNFTGGFSATTMAEAFAVFPRFLVGDGIVAGYRFRYQTWSMSTDLFDQTCLSHGPFLGVLL